MFSTFSFSLFLGTKKKTVFKNSKQTCPKNRFKINKLIIYIYSNSFYLFPVRKSLKNFSYI